MNDNIAIVIFKKNVIDVSQLPREFQRYLDEAMGLKVVLSPFAGRQTLPHFIQQFHVLYELSLASPHFPVLFRGVE